jgi:hypothetical protein
MDYIQRELETQVRLAAANFPAQVLTGPRRGGKTFRHWQLNAARKLPWKCSSFICI